MGILSSIVCRLSSCRLKRLLIESKRVVAIHFDTHPHHTLTLLQSMIEFHGQKLSAPPRVWPLQVSELLIANGDTDTKNAHEIDHRTHTDFVQNYLSMLSRQHQRYLTQFDTIKSQLNYFTDALGYHMERYVLKNALVTVQLLFDARIALIKRAYTDRWLQLEFLQQKPDEDQASSQSQSMFLRFLFCASRFNWRITSVS